MSEGEEKWGGLKAVTTAAAVWTLPRGEVGGLKARKSWEV